MSPMLGLRLLIALFALGAGGRCTSAMAAATDAGPGDEIRLQVGQSAAMSGDALTITFTAVDSDSRCPKGEACIAEGDAVVRITVKRASGIPREQVLHTSSRGPAVAADADWSIRLVSLEPIPVTGRPMQEDGYIVTLQVIHDSAKAGGIR